MRIVTPNNTRNKGWFHSKIFFPSKTEIGSKLKIAISNENFVIKNSNKLKKSKIGKKKRINNPIPEMNRFTKGPAKDISPLLLSEPYLWWVITTPGAIIFIGKKMENNENIAIFLSNLK